MSVTAVIVEEFEHQKRIWTLALASLIRARRLTLGLGQEDFAKLVHGSQSMISRWETGATMPSVFEMTKLNTGHLDLSTSANELVRLAHVAASQIERNSLLKASDESVLGLLAFIIATRPDLAVE